MKKTYKMENLDCANCAAKMEHDIRRLEGVKSAKISFITQRFTLEAEDDKVQDILDNAQKICSKYERHCRIIY